MDASALVSFAFDQNKNNTVNESYSKAPNLNLFSLPRSSIIQQEEAECLLAIAWTDTNCSAQLLLTSSPSPPISIWTCNDSNLQVIVSVKAFACNSGNVTILIATAHRVYSIPVCLPTTTLMLELQDTPTLLFPNKSFVTDYFLIHGCDFVENKMRVQDFQITHNLFLWIVFTSGSAIRLSLDSQHHSTVSATDEIIQIHLLFSPSSHFNNNLVPLPKYHPSSSLIIPQTPIYEAISYGDGVSSLTFYTSDDSFTGGATASQISIGFSGELRLLSSPSSVYNHNKTDATTTNTTTITSNIIVGTKAIVKGVLGTILWSRWGSVDYDSSNSNSPYNYSSTHNSDSAAAAGAATASNSSKISGDGIVILTQDSTEPLTNSDDVDSGTSTQDVVLHKFLLPQQTLLDPPRKITSVTMDPLGNYCSVVDTLGRVMLIDLSTKQIVRMWKGLRDAKCYWIINSEETFLVIHARQRSLVEIWKMMHGPRVYKMEVSSSDFRIFQCSPTNTTITNCYTMQSGIIAPLNVPSQRDIIMMDNSICSPDVLINSASTSDKYALIRRSPVLHLQLLNQLLSEESSVPPTPESVYNAILQFTSTLDLSNALDLIASSSYLEEGLLLTGDEHELFYSRVVHLCQEKLALAEEQHNFLQQHADLLRRNIQFHTQVIEAYDLIRNFELDTFGDEEEEEDGEEIEDGEIVGAPRTPWAEEAMSWIETYEEVTGGPLLGINDTSSKFLKFSSFFKACHMQSSSNSDVYYKAGTADRSVIPIELCDSSKDRIVILSHVFSPLLKDIFVFKTVNLVFNSLGLSRNFPLLEQVSILFSHHM